MKRIPKTYSVSEVARLRGYHYQSVARMCQRGKLGSKCQLPGSDYYEWRISEKEFRTLKPCKNQGLQQSQEKS